MSVSLVRLGLAAMLAIGIAGCGGDDGAQGPAGPAGPAGPTGPTGKDLTAVIKISELAPDQWAALDIRGEVTKVTIASKPVVEFKLADPTGKPILGLGANTSASGTLTQLTNARFALAKLVPGTGGSPSQWVSYMVTSNTGAPARPDTDRVGTLVDNGDGTYKYTFYRDVATIKDQVAAATVPATANKADLGDLTYAPNLQHRLAIQISGSQAGGTVNLGKAVNLIYDFVPATGAKIAKADLQKDVVNIATCNNCHGQLALHGGGRVDTAYCVTCHTTQRAYGQPRTTSPFPALQETANVNTTTGITGYSYAPDMYVADGEVLGNFTTLVHKIHQGGSLTKQNYEYANVAFNNKGFSMLGGGQRMCTVCHDSAVASKADHWNTKPSRQACGACHDNVSFVTGDGHIGRAQADDSLCVACHQPATTAIDHRTVNLTAHNQALTDGLVHFTYLIDSATVDASNNLKIVFAIQQQTAPSTTKSFATLPLSSNFTGGPSFLLSYAAPENGITPLDYNNAGQSQAQAKSVSLANLVNGTAGTLVASSSKTGYYEATIANGFPAGAKMRTVGLQAYWTQVTPPAARHAISVVKTVTGDTARRRVVDATKCANCHEWFEGHGGSRVIGKETGSTAELVCMQCHVPGMATSGRRIPDTGTNSMTTYAWTDADKKTLRAWGLMDSSNQFIKSANIALDLPVVSNNFKDMIHGIHAGRDRVTPFRDARDRNTVKVLLDFRRMDFPGVLRNCDTCHLAGTYNAVPLNALPSTHESINATYAAAIAGGTATPAMAGASLATSNSTDAVKTPFGSACVSCHDGPAQQAHMQQNGAMLKTTRAQAVGSFESCAVCHGPGAEWDAATIHR